MSHFEGLAIRRAMVGKVRCEGRSLREIVEMVRWNRWDKRVSGWIVGIERVSIVLIKKKGIVLENVVGRVSVPNSNDMFGVCLDRVRMDGSIVSVNEGVVTDNMDKQIVRLPDLAIQRRDKTISVQCRECVEAVLDGDVVTRFLSMFGRKSSRLFETLWKWTEEDVGLEDTVLECEWEKRYRVVLSRVRMQMKPVTIKEDIDEMNLALEELEVDVWNGDPWKTRVSVLKTRLATSGNNKKCAVDMERLVFGNVIFRAKRDESGSEWMSFGRWNKHVAGILDGGVEDIRGLNMDRFFEQFNMTGRDFPMCNLPRLWRWCIEIGKMDVSIGLGVLAWDLVDAVREWLGVFGNGETPSQEKIRVYIPGIVLKIDEGRVVWRDDVFKKQLSRVLYRLESHHGERVIREDLFWKRSRESRIGIDGHRGYGGRVIQYDASMYPEMLYRSQRLGKLYMEYLATESRIYIDSVSPKIFTDLAMVDVERLFFVTVPPTAFIEREDGRFVPSKTISEYVYQLYGMDRNCGLMDDFRWVRGSWISSRASRVHVKISPNDRISVVDGAVEGVIVHVGEQLKRSARYLYTLLVNVDSVQGWYSYLFGRVYMDCVGRNVIRYLRGGLRESRAGIEDRLRGRLRGSTNEWKVGVLFGRERLDHVGWIQSRKRLEMDVRVLESGVDVDIVGNAYVSLESSDLVFLRKRLEFLELVVEVDGEDMKNRLFVAAVPDVVVRFRIWGNETREVDVRIRSLDGQVNVLYYHELGDFFCRWIRRNSILKRSSRSVVCVYKVHLDLGNVMARGIQFVDNEEFLGMYANVDKIVFEVEKRRDGMVMLNGEMFSVGMDLMGPGVDYDGIVRTSVCSILKCRLDLDEKGILRGIATRLRCRWSRQARDKLVQIWTRIMTVEEDMAMFWRMMEKSRDVFEEKRLNVFPGIEMDVELLDTEIVLESPGIVGSGAVLGVNRSNLVVSGNRKVRVLSEEVEVVVDGRKLGENKGVDIVMEYEDRGGMGFWILFQMYVPDVVVAMTSMEFCVLYDIVTNLFFYSDLEKKQRHDDLNALVLMMDMAEIPEFQTHVQLSRGQIETPRTSKQETLLRMFGNQQGEKIVECLEQMARMLGIYRRRIRTLCRYVFRGKLDLEGGLVQAWTVLNEEYDKLSRRFGLMCEAFRFLYVSETRRDMFIRGRVHAVPVQSNVQIRIQTLKIDWTLVMESGGKLARIVLDNVEVRVDNCNDGSMEVRTEIQAMNLVNELEDAYYRELMSPVIRRNNDEARKDARMFRSLFVARNGDAVESPEMERVVGEDPHVRVFWREMAPVGGISVLERVEINLEPSEFGFTHDIVSRIVDFVFPSMNIENRERKDMRLAASFREYLHNIHCDVDEMRIRSSRHRSFITILIPSGFHTISYKGKGRSRSFRDINRIGLTLPDVMYQNKTWSWYELLMALKKEAIRVLLSNTRSLVRARFLKRK